jgi:transposase
VLCDTWVLTVIHRYNAGGPDGLRDRRRSSPGHPPMVAVAVREELRARLADPSPDGSLWTSPKVAVWLSEQVGRTISPQRAWETMRRIGFSLHQLRPGHPAADPVAQAAFEKGLAEAVTTVRTAHPDARVTAWAEDEHRLGLIPIRCRVWALIGQRPTAPSDRHSQWLWVYGFVRPTTGETWWCLLPTLAAAAISAALAAFAQDAGIDATHQCAGLGRGRRPYQCAGRGAGEDRPGAAAAIFAGTAIGRATLAAGQRSRGQSDLCRLDALEEVLVARCRTLHADQMAIRPLTYFHWWPADTPLDIPK